MAASPVPGALVISASESEMPSSITPGCCVISVMTWVWLADMPAEVGVVSALLRLQPDNAPTARSKSRDARIEPRMKSSSVYSGSGVAPGPGQSGQDAIHHGSGHATRDRVAT